MEFEIINYLKNNSTKKEIQNNLIDLIFKEVKTKEEIGNSKYIIIPNSITSIKYNAFENCSSLTSITIPYSVKSIGVYAFDSCNRLTAITIPNSVTSIGVCAFKNCNSLTSITIPNSVTYIGDYSFKNCSSLTSITIPRKFDLDMNNIFKDVDLSKVKIIYI